LGGHLPGRKVTREIAEIRGAAEGTDIISPAHFKDILNKDDLKKKVSWLRDVSGGKPIGIKFAAGDIEADLEVALYARPDFAKALALGATAVSIGTTALIALGCRQFRICNTGRCPMGITTHDPALRKRLDIDAAAKRLENFLKVTNEELKDFARLTGHDKDVADQLDGSKGVSTIFDAVFQFVLLRGCVVKI
jgi:glutamate synthase domain-containing protein 2